MSQKRSASIGLFLVFALGSTSTAVAAVHALFDLRAPTGGPFPSDWFTVADLNNLTRLRMNLPLPDCAARPSDCEDLAVINTLDGFNLQPRLSIPFDGPIDVATVSSRTVFLVSLGSTVRGHDDEGCDESDRDEGDCDEGGRVIGINQVVWDTFTNTLHVQSDELLDQHARFALIATHGVRDREGREVEASEAFRRFRQMVRGEYRDALLEAVQAARRIGIRESDMVTASVFTTQSATAILEKIRDQIKAATPEAADFRLGPGGTRTVFARNQVSNITFNRQTHVSGPLDPVRVAIELLDVIPGAVGTLAFGKYLSSDYAVHPGEYIPPVRTRTGTPAVRGVNEIYFNLILPSGSKPAGGWPVAIFGIGSPRNKNEDMVLVSAAMAERGIATIVTNPVGMGYGPLSTLMVDQTVGGPVTFLEGGRGIDQNGDGDILANEGFFAAPPRTIIEFHDGLRQTVADLMQLVRVIEVGMDVDGDGSRTLNPSRIYFFGISVGGFYGTQLLAVDPSVRAGVLTVPGGLWSPWRRLSSGILGNRPSLGNRLLLRSPPLLNPPGVTQLGGVAVGAPYYHENQPLRNGIPLLVRLEDGTDQETRSPVINTVAGASAIQEMMDNRDLVGMSGDPVAYAPHLRKHPLAGVRAKSVIVQFAKGDQLIPNPIATALLRAGDLADRATFYRHDLARAANPRLPTDPHVFMISVEDPNWPNFTPIALAVQEQIAVFFATDGERIIHPEPARFFEVPMKGPLPEDLNFIIP